MNIQLLNADRKVIGTATKVAECSNQIGAVRRDSNCLEKNKVLQVANWGASFETRGTQVFKCKSNFVLPRKQGIGYRLLLQRPNGAELYGAWCSLILLLSGHSIPRNGYLTHDGSPFGRPYVLKEIELLTFIPEHTFSNLFTACLSPEIAWMTTVSPHALSGTQQVPVSHNNPNPNNISDATSSCEQREMCRVPESCETVADYFETTKLAGGRDAGISFFNHFSAQGWVRANGLPVKSWKALARQWNNAASLRTTHTKEENSSYKRITLEDEE